MASIVKKNIAQKDDDDEDLEALRIAALMTIPKKQLPPSKPQPSNVIFQPHMGNPNLIAIIPEGAARPPVRHNFFRTAPRQQPFRAANTISTVGSNLKVLHQVQINDKESVTSSGEQKVEESKEEVSSKFSRFEDTESESEDESDHEKKESESSEDDNDDVLALEDDDDSLEALMAQMEHEIGIDPDPNKKEKKKCKSSNKLKNKDTKCKESELKNKDTKCKESEKEKLETKTAVVEPTIKESVVVRVVKYEENKSSKQQSPKPERHKSPLQNHSIKASCEVENKMRFSPPKSTSSVRKSKSPIRQRSQTPPNRIYSPPRGKTSVRMISKSRSPIKQKTLSPRRSPTRSKSPPTRQVSPARRKSPRKLTPERRSPLRKSSDRYYPGNRSPSPYYRSRDREYSLRNRSPSPIKRRSLSPRKNQRDPSPKYYRKRSVSPWSPVYRPSASARSPSPKYRSRSPLLRCSLSPRNRKTTKPTYSQQSPPYWSPPKRRSPSPSPKRFKSPIRKKDYSPKRRQTSPRREFSYRKNSLSPKRKPSPQYKKYSTLSPRHKQRSISPRNNSPPKRRTPPVTVKESRSKMDLSKQRRSRSPSLSLSPSPPREIKESSRRYKSPLRPRKESADNSNNRTIRPRRNYSPDIGKDTKDKKKTNSKIWDRDEKKSEEKRKEKTDKVMRREKESFRSDRQRHDESKEEVQGLKVCDNPIFEARRRKFENTRVIEPASKKIRLGNKKTSPVEDKAVKEEKLLESIEVKKVEDDSDHLEDEKSVHNEIDEIDNFLNEDVLDLSAAFWSSDDDLLPVVKTKKEKVVKKENIDKKVSVKERITLKEKGENHKRVAAVSPLPIEKKTGGKSKPASPPIAKQERSPEHEAVEERKEREDGDLRAELSRRREERLTKAGSLHEKLPARLLQSAFESALGKKKSKKEGKLQKSEKESKKSKASISPPAPKERTDGRRVLVLKRPTAVRMQSAHINVTFPKDGGSDSESSYSSSSSDERYSAPTTAKRRLPVYMRLGTAQTKHSGSRKVKLRSRRNQV